MTVQKITSAPTSTEIISTINAIIDDKLGKDEKAASATEADTAMTADNVTGTVAVANGGTGATDAATARTNLGITAENLGITTYSYATNAEALEGENTTKLITPSTMQYAVDKWVNDWKYDRGNGTEGALNPTSNVTLSAGIHNYTSINIPSGVTVTVTERTILKCQGACTIAGTINGNGSNATKQGSNSGARIGGGSGATSSSNDGSSGTAGTNGGSNTAGKGGMCSGNRAAGGAATILAVPTDYYANNGGGGGGGSTESGGSTGGGGGGGGAGITIVAKTINLTGTITSKGGNGYQGGYHSHGGGGGGGGNVYLVANKVTNSGTVTLTGGTGAVCGSNSGGNSGTAGQLKTWNLAG